MDQSVIERLVSVQREELEAETIGLKTEAVLEEINDLGIEHILSCPLMAHLSG